MAGIYIANENQTQGTELDTHICGVCKSCFYDIDSFVLHKRAGCSTGKDSGAIPVSSANLMLTDPVSGIFLSREATSSASSAFAARLEPSEITNLDLENESYLVSHGVTDTKKCTSGEKLTNEIFLTSAPAHASTESVTISQKHLKNEIVAVRNSKKYLCTFEGCKYSSSYPKDLLRHSMIHSGEKPFRCKMCDRCFNRLDKLKIHERQHSGLKPYKCSHCDYAAADCSSLKKHIRTHSDERPYRCQMCQYASRNSSQLTVHLRTHTGDAPFACPHCPSKFKINSDLTRHVRLHTGEKPFACQLCNFRCSIKGNLNTHVRINHSNKNLLQCLQCEFCSPSSKLLRQHQKSHLPETTMIQCSHSQCNYKCKTDAALRKHILVHCSERPFKCSYCPYSSRQQGNVRAHSKKRHPDKEKISRLRRPDQKLQPPGRLNRPLTAARSERVDQIRPPKSDGSKPNLKLDRNRHLRPQCVQAFHCQECHAAFVREDSLRSHLRQHQQAHQRITSTTTTAKDIKTTPTVTVSDYRTPCELLLAAAATVSSEPSDYESSDNRKEPVQNVVDHSGPLTGNCHQPTVLCFSSPGIGPEQAPSSSSSESSATGAVRNSLSPCSEETVLVNGDVRSNEGGVFGIPAGVHPQLVYQVQAYRSSDNVVQYVLQATQADCGGLAASTDVLYVPVTDDTSGTFYQVTPASTLSSEVSQQIVNFVVGGSGQGALMEQDVLGNPLLMATGAHEFLGNSAVALPASHSGYTSVQVLDGVVQPVHQQQSSVVLCASECLPPHSTVVYTGCTSGPTLVTSADSTVC